MAHSHPHGHDHDHGGHDHSHTPAVTGDNERKVLVSFVIIFAYMLVEMAGGLLSGSLALLADAGHMLTDAVALGLAYAAFRFGRRAADGRRTFGYLRLEVIAGFVNAITLFGIVFWIVYEAIRRMQEPYEILAGPMLGIAIVGLLVNLFVFWYLSRGDSEHVNIRGAILHVLGDLLGSVGAIAAALVIWLTGWTPIDPILSILVSLLILRSAWGLLRRTLHILLEGAPDNADAAEIARHLENTIPGVARVSDVHVWLITSGRALATLKIKPREGADILATIRAAEEALKARFAIEHPTVGVDWEGADGCSLSEAAAPHAHDSVQRAASGSHVH